LVSLLEEAYRISISTLNNRDGNITSQDMYYILNTKTISNHMWKLFASHTWTGNCIDASTSPKHDRHTENVNGQKVTVDGFLRVIKHISAPR